MTIMLSLEQEMLRDSVRKLMAKHASPEIVRELDRRQAYPTALYEAWVEAGLLAMPFAEADGGLGGTLLDAAIITEEIARVSGDFAMAYMGSVFCGLNLARNGSAEQKAQWLPLLMNGDIKFSIGISEPEAGSDAGAIQTFAERDGDSWVINGRKIWQTGAGASKNVIHLYARTTKGAPHSSSLSLILVPNDLAGISMRKLDMLGLLLHRHL